MSAQKRGDALKIAIRNTILSMKEETEKEGKVYAFNAKKLAETVPASRTTVQRNMDFIEGVLDEMGVKRRKHTGAQQMKQLQTRIERLENQVKDKDERYEALAQGYAALIKGLMLASSDPTLVQKIKRHTDKAAQQGAVAPDCPHCGQSLLDGHTGDILSFRKPQ